MIKQLNDGLVLRSLDDGTQQDREQLPLFYSETFREAGDDEADGILLWVNDLIDKHPHMTYENFLYVVDTNENDKIVSAVLLIPQTWYYENIDIPVGRIEIVATDKAYRRRGLVRELMNAGHRLSESRGDLMQSITGIDYYYRQFGYSLAVNLGIGSSLSVVNIQTVKEDEESPFTIRRATPDDIEAMIAISQYERRQYRLSVKRTHEIFQYEIQDQHPDSPISRVYHVIVNRDEAIVGYLAHNYLKESSKAAYIFQYAVGEQSSAIETFDPVMAALTEQLTQTAPNLSVYMLSSDVSPHVRQMINRRRTGKADPTPYTWYLRVSDTVEFFKRITPVLETRLVGSGAHRYTGSLTMSFYNFEQVTLHFENGKITDVSQEDYDEVGKVSGKLSARFPFDSWHNLIFGHRTIDELLYAFPDLDCHSQAAYLLSILFPKKDSSLVGIA